MESKISLITIWTDNIVPMKTFYSEILGFTIQRDLGEHVEFESEGVRFAICLRKVMYSFSEEFTISVSGQAFELAFPCKCPEDVDRSYDELIVKGARAIKAPQNMPWNQRTALFADPDGNIHEIFAEMDHLIK